MAKARQLVDAEIRARALARWEGEGGALAPAVGDETIDDAALRLLARLGAALLEAWDEVPADLQERIAQRARTLGSPADRARAKSNLGQFLHRSGPER